MHEVNVVCSTGTTILRVNATDLDILQNARITYYLGPGGKDNFGIDSNDGSLFILPNRSLVVDHPPTYYNITVVCRFFSTQTAGFCGICKKMLMIYSAVKKNPEDLWQFFQNGWEFLNQILHAYYAFLSTLDYEFLFN